MSPKRQLVYGFYVLPHVIRMQILINLNLTKESDQHLKDGEKQVQYFRRAEQNGVLDKLWDAIQQHNKNLGKNPFIKTP